MNLKVTRDQVDAALDRARFKLDSYPTMDYQPLPWLGAGKARRGSGVESRWAAIEAELDELDADGRVDTAVDIGSNVGFFSISLAKRGVATLGVEHYPKYYRPYLYALRRLQLRHAGALVLEVTPRTLGLVPEVDCVLFLSVWHHIVRADGEAVAKDFLSTLWSKARRVMFFETGETELPGHWNMPAMAPSPEAFLPGYLAEACKGADVVDLGRHDAFAPDGSPCQRSLFAVVRR
jgi:hypothetical protein